MERRNSTYSTVGSICMSGQVKLMPLGNRFHRPAWHLLGSCPCKIFRFNVLILVYYFRAADAHKLAIEKSKYLGGVYSAMKLNYVVTICVKRNFRDKLH